MPNYQTVQIPIATNGLNKDLQPTQIPSASPNMKNMIVEPWGVRKRLGYSTLGINLPVILSGDSGIGMELVQYTDARGEVHHLVLTTTCAYEYDSSSLQWLDIMPSTQMQDCEDNAEWNAGSNITLSDSTDEKEGTNALKMLAGAGISAGDKIADTTTFDDSADTSDYGAIAHVSFWFYSSKAGVSITVHVKDAGDDIEALSFAATDAATWYHVCREVDLSDIDTVTSLEIDTETALVDTDYIMIDDIRASASFSGDTTNRWSHTIAHDTSKFTNNGGSALIISNGTKGLYYFEGVSSGRFVALDISDSGEGDFTNFASCKEIVEFWNHFFAINYSDSSANVRSLAYADLGNMLAYTTGTSGSYTLTDTVGKLLRAKKMGSDLILYSENSITTCRYIGGGLSIFIFPTLVYETGLFCEKGLWDFVRVHYFIGTDQKIYGYGGGQQLLPIGDQIEDSMFSSMDISKKDKVVVGVDPTKHKVYFFYPESGDTYSNKAYVYNYKQQPKTWEYHEFGDTIRDFSVFSNKSGWYADGPELAGTYADEEVFYADASYTQSDYPVPVVLSHDGYVFKLDETTGKDNATNIACIYETMDITIDAEEHYFRTSWVSFNLMSTVASATYDLKYSTDGGLNFTAISTGNSISSAAADTWKQHRTPFDATSRKIRFRLEQNSAKDIRIRSGHMKVMVETDRE